MSKKLTIIFITTFIIALAFFSSYLIVREVRGVGGVVNISELNMAYYKITDLPNPASGSDAVNKGYLSVLPILYIGDKSITTWCDVSNFSWCSDPYVPPEPPEEPPCFTAETQILMADNTYKNIADVQPGEYVLTRESENSAKLVKAKVLDVYEHWYDWHFIINGELEVTYHHAMFVNGEWKNVKYIKLGDKLLNRDNQEVIVESIEKRTKEREFKVYNLEIEKYQTYFAGGFYVHNIGKNGED